MKNKGRTKKEQAARDFEERKGMMNQEIMDWWKTGKNDLDRLVHINILKVLDNRKKGKCQIHKQ